jgi:flagellar motor switch protein FliN/FliY
MAESQPQDEAASATPAPAAPPAEPAPAADTFSIDELLKQASFEDPAKVQEAAGSAPVAPGAQAATESAPVPSPVTKPAPESGAEFRLPSFQQAMRDAQVSSIDLLRDVELNVKIELGRSQMMVEDVLKLAEGSVVELDKLAGDPVDVFVNDRLVARGEVLVLNDNFCVRVNEIVAGAKEEAL